MRAAEHLYLSGYLSYPRTESSSYPSSFDFRETLGALRHHWELGEYAAELIKTGYSSPRHGHDAGDHPPITPVGVPSTPAALGGSDEARLFDMVVRHFLASISPDETYEQACIQRRLISTFNDKKHNNILILVVVYRLKLSLSRLAGSPSRPEAAASSTQASQCCTLAAAPAMITTRSMKRAIKTKIQHLRILNCRLGSFREWYAISVR